LSSLACPLYVSQHVLRDSSGIPHGRSSACHRVPPPVLPPTGRYRPPRLQVGLVLPAYRSVSSSPPTGRYRPPAYRSVSYSPPTGRYRPPRLQVGLVLSSRQGRHRRPVNAVVISLRCRYWASSLSLPPPPLPPSSPVPVPVPVTRHPSSR